jgi:hypothetical protein
MFDNNIAFAYNVPRLNLGRLIMNRQPRWCDLDCPHASFPREDSLDGACHTFIALWCDKYGRLVQKSALCLDMKGEKENE